MKPEIIHHFRSFVHLPSWEISLVTIESPTSYPVYKSLSWKFAVHTPSSLEGHWPLDQALVKTSLW